MKIFAVLLCASVFILPILNLSADDSTGFKDGTETNKSISGKKEVPFEIFLGRKLFSEKKYQEAAALLQAAMDKKTATADDLALLGICYIKLDKKKKAKEVLDTALKMNKESFAVYMGLGTLAFQNKDFKRSLVYFTNAHSIREESIQAVKGISASLINLGVEEFAKGDKKNAEKTFKRALKFNPGSVPAMRNLGIVYEKSGRDSDAVKMYRSALKIQPDDSVVLRLLSDILEKEGKKDELFRVLKRLASVQPYNPYAYEKSGQLYESRGETEKAVESFSKAVKNGSEKPYPYFRMAEYYYKRGNKERAHSNLFLAVGRAVHRMGILQLQAAGRIKKKGGKLDREDIKELKKYSGLISKPQKVLKDSIELIKKIDKTNSNFKKDIGKLSLWYPHNVELKETLADILAEDGKYSEALRVWEKLAQDHPTDVKAHTGIAEVYERTGKIDSAILEYRRALDLDSEKESIYLALYNLYKKGNREKELYGILKDRYLRDRRNILLLKYLINTAEDLGQKKDADYFKRELNRISSK
ncbi:MAG: tetratricopeptide repeat protein [Spirochaetes bacterium]|nr:tetratricopeptide repeat protein [Spirochaetota bacterium]